MNCLSAKFFANQSSEPLHTIRIEKEHSASLSGTIVNFQKDVNQYLTSIIEKTGKQSTVASTYLYNMFIHKLKHKLSC